MKFSKQEKEDLFKAWFALSIAFAILINEGFSLSLKFLEGIVLSAFTVGIAFLLHELSHKFFAQKYNCWAEFRANTTMLILAVLMSFLGFILVAPGAVMISGRISKKQNGIISLAGPMMNIFLGVIYLIGAILVFSLENSLIKQFFTYGYIINAWLAVFNLLPFGIFDGKKVYVWNKGVYAVAMLLAIGLLVLTL
jgi:Zn-dependent protease